MVVVRPGHQASRLPRSCAIGALVHSGVGCRVERSGVTWIDGNHPNEPVGARSRRRPGGAAIGALINPVDQRPEVDGLGMGGIDCHPCGR